MGGDPLSRKGAVTVRLTEELQALVDDEVRNGAYPSAEAYIQSLLIEEQACRPAELLALLDAGLASGVAEGEGLEAFDRAVARAREKSRSHAG